MSTVWVLALFILLETGEYHYTPLEQFTSFEDCETMRLYVAAEMGTQYPDTHTLYLKCLPIKTV